MPSTVISRTCHLNFFPKWRTTFCEALKKTKFTALDYKVVKAGVPGRLGTSVKIMPKSCFIFL